MRRIIPFIFFLAVAWVSTHSRDNENASTSTSFGYRFPDVPDSIKQPKERAEYLACHFWDNVALKDYENLVSVNTFLYVVNLITPEQQDRCLAKFLTESFTDLDLYSKIAYYLDITIGDAESDLRNDRLYLYAQKFITDSSLPLEYKIAPAWRISLFEKNMQGAQATDLKLSDESGNEVNLLDLPKPLIVVFASSECSRCKKELPNFVFRFNELESSNWNIAIIYVDGKKPEYTLPKNCYVLFDTDKSIIEDDLYLIRRLPSLYLIDEDNIIIKSELTVDDLLKKLRISF